MNTRVEIRESAPHDLASIEKLYPDAFPEENLLPLVKDLLQEAPIILSLVGIIDKSLVGHVIFTKCGIVAGTDQVALLGPLAVAPAWQRKGIGTAIVQEGLQQLESAGVTHVYVLGDPNYYGRFGFETEAGVMPPYPLPPEWHGAWQGTSLRSSEASLRGRLSVPKPWLQPGLWAP